MLRTIHGKGIPISRHEQIMSYVGGEDCKWSKPAIFGFHPRFIKGEFGTNCTASGDKIRLMTWTKAVFLMISKGRTGGLLAVSCSQPVDEPPADSRLSRKERKIWSERQKMYQKMAGQFSTTMVGLWKGMSRCVSFTLGQRRR